VISPEGDGRPLPDTDQSGGASPIFGGASPIFGGASTIFGGASTKFGGASLVKKYGVYKDSPKGNLRAEPTLKTMLTNLPSAPPLRKNDAAESGGASAEKVAEGRCGFWGRHIEPAELASPGALQGLFEIALRRRPLFGANRVNFFATAHSVVRRQAEGAEIGSVVATFTSLVSRFRWFASQSDEDWARSAIAALDGRTAAPVAAAAQPLAEAFAVEEQSFEEQKATAVANMKRAIAEGRIRR
jgi:hypothetical protein